MIRIRYPNSALLRKFGRDVWQDWRARLNAILSILFACLALALNSAAGKTFLIIACAFSLLSTSYRIWLRQRLQIDQFLEALAPKINISTRYEKGGVLPSAAKPEHPSKLIQIKISCATEAEIEECEVRICSVDAIGEGCELVEEEVNCLWSGEENNLSINIRPNSVRYADLFVIYEENVPDADTEFFTKRTIIDPRIFPRRINFLEGISQPGRYRVRVIATARGTPTATRSFIFAWTDFADVSFIPE